MNKKIVSLALFGFASLLCAPLGAQDAAKKNPSAPKKQASGTQQRVSPHETVSARLAGEGRDRSLVTITYGRPYSARGGKGEPRKIWGGLVPWDKADRLGADEATLILLQHPIQAQGKTIPAGAYTLYIVPSEAGVSKLAFSSNIGKWGVPVDETKDIARFDLTKSSLDRNVDQLTLAIDNAPPKGGVLRIRWERTEFSLPFTVVK
jgi:hypothetical protein